MTHDQSDENHNSTIHKKNKKSFADFWMGTFFMISTVSLIIVMLMFIFIWQPIWTEGFKDFHTISNAIDKLDRTAKPASEAIPLMLSEMNQMNKTMHEMNKMNVTLYDMQNIMKNMDESLGTIEEMTPSLKRMTQSTEQMSMVLYTQMPQMTYLMGRVGNKMPNMDFMPFN